MASNNQMYTQNQQYIPMPIKCEPVSPTTLPPASSISNYPISTSVYMSQYMPIYVNSIAHSPQLPPTPPSPMTNQMSNQCITSFPMPIVAQQSQQQHCPATSPSPVASSPAMTEQQQQQSPRSVSSTRYQSQKQATKTKSVPVQKSADSAGIAARMAAAKHSQQQNETTGKRMKLNSTGRSANSVTKRNERERKRVKNVNMGFQTLRARIPNCTKKMSKVETLRSAVDYIRSLQQVLYGSEGASLPEMDFNVDTDSNNSQAADLDFFDLDELLC
jgi:hypothetical protein